ncbi:MAG: sensor histidine kinase [Acholeplasmatales bacterium]|nr:sensor histidine kinase [Acholeplasmatales bacterium]
MREKLSINIQILLVTLTLLISFTVIIIFTSMRTYSNSINNSIHIYSDEIKSQIVYNYEAYFGRIINFSNSISKYIERIDPLTEEDSVKTYFLNICDSSTEVMGITLFDTIGTTLITTNNDQEDSNSNQTILNEAITNPTIHQIFIPDESNSLTLVIAKYVTFNKTLNNGVLKIDIDFSNIIDLSKTSNLGEDGHLLIIDSNYRAIYSSNNLQREKDIALLRKLILGSQITKYDNTTFQISLETLPNTKLRIAVFIDISLITQAESIFYRNLVIYSLVFMVIAVFSVYFIIKSLVNPISNLRLGMQNYSYRLERINVSKYKSSKETYELAMSFNQMSNRIEDLMQKIYQEQLAQRKSELKALQNQINPQFLYNTLDTICWMIEQNKNEDATKLVIALSKLFRISISKGKNIISVKQEIEHARNYLLIQSIRFNNIFTYEFIYDEKEIENLETIKLLLQPIIENSINHGMKNYPDDGNITILIKTDEKNIIYQVKDNGYGMSKEKVKELYDNLENYTSNQGIGIKNTYQRLKLYYLGEAKFIIESDIDNGTTVTITVPKEVSNEESISY